MAESGLSKTPADMTFAARNRTFDLHESLGRDWHGDRAFQTAFFNALSFSFPSGEKFFVDSVKHYLPRIDDAKLKRDAAVFVQQEYTHRREHQRYNQALAAARGFDAEKLEALFQNQIKRINKEPPIVRLAATVVLEHVTAMFAAGSMRYHRWMEGADAAMADLWQWHAVEETEHKSVAFDVFLAVGGKRKLLRRVMRIVRVRFPYHVFITIFRMRRMEGKPALSLSFWREGYRFLFGRSGIIREVAADFRLFYRDDFHPWLINNRDQLQETIMRLGPEPELHANSSS
ncbi:MAG: metal-dependent hydrolase [Woeseia sp.]|nr:metal-dependent hydrolase [Woeseia sp.]MBT8096347.1 metal-dependent hydrolase [Woeseia sp.]NNE60511.1 metal-dependent hydrolase [Woeseia sp.]NNL54973.1 metal-dependent hydrolase [Woeseia sp.]